MMWVFFGCSNLKVNIFFFVIFCFFVLVCVFGLDVLMIWKVVNVSFWFFIWFYLVEYRGIRIFWDGYLMWVFFCCYDLVKVVVWGFVSVIWEFLIWVWNESKFIFFWEFLENVYIWFLIDVELLVL